MKKRAVIYARFSSHSQTEQSIEGQLRECYEFARKNKYIEFAKYGNQKIFLNGWLNRLNDLAKFIETF